MDGSIGVVDDATRLLYDIRIRKSRPREMIDEYWIPNVIVEPMMGRRRFHLIFIFSHLLLPPLSQPVYRPFLARPTVRVDRRLIAPPRGSADRDMMLVQDTGRDEGGMGGQRCWISISICQIKVLMIHRRWGGREGCTENTRASVWGYFKSSRFRTIPRQKCQ